MSGNLSTRDFNKGFSLFLIEYSAVVLTSVIVVKVCQTKTKMMLIC